MSDELDRVLEEVSRVRHEVNNALGAAMAETQLLLLDADDDEARRSLEVVLQQLRRIRDAMVSVGRVGESGE